MSIDDALRHYRKDRFTDLDVTRGTDLSLRGWRELIKLGSVRTVTETGGRGHVRLCDATVFKRAAVISALNQAGLSLAVSGQIAYFLPFHTLLYTICDPTTILFHGSADVDPNTGLPPRVEVPITDWFDPDKPDKPDAATDWLIEIYDGRFVGGIYNPNDEPTIFGDLRNEGTSFVAWKPLHRRPHFSGTTEQIAKTLSYSLVDFVAEWENPLKQAKELKLLDYKFEKHDIDNDHVRLAAEATARSPIFKTTINVTLAIKKAIRRYLGIEPPMLGSEIGEPRLIPDVGSSATPPRKQKRRRKSEN